MGESLGAALVLGLGGLDPTPALIAVAALIAGASRRSLTAFGLIVMVGAPLLGSVLSLTVASRLVDVRWRDLLPTGRLAAVLGLVVGLVLLAYGLVRVVRPWSRVTRHQTHHRGSAAMITGGLVYVTSLVVDPTFVAVTLLAGRTEHPTSAVAMEVVWVLVAQLPFLILVIGVSRLGQERAAEDFQRGWARLKPVLHQVVTVALVIVGLVLVADASAWFVSGRFLLALT